MEPVTLNYPRDTLRYRYFVKESNQHQAKMELRTFKWIVENYTKPGDTILDPMSGIGTIHFANFMGRNTIAIELVPEFIKLQFRNLSKMAALWGSGDFYIVDDNIGPWDFQVNSVETMGGPIVLEGDCRSHLPHVRPLEACIFSPPYGGLWAFNAKARSTKIAQEKHYVVGYDDAIANVGNLTNYAAYLVAMKIIYRKCFESLRSGAPLVTVVKDYMHQGRRVPCSKDNTRLCLEAGFDLENWHFRRADIQNNPFSAGHRAKRVAAGKHKTEFDIGIEDIIVMRKP